MTSYAHSFSPGGEPKPAPKFKVGDVIRALSNTSDDSYMGGRHYVVSKVVGKVVYTEEDSNGSHTNGWGVDHFELAEAPKKSKQQGCAPKALETQVGGSHYTDMAIQPAAYNLANNIGWAEGDAISYISRWRNKGGLQDLRKARQTLLLLIEHEEALGTK